MIDFVLGVLENDVVVEIGVTAFAVIGGFSATAPIINKIRIRRYGRKLDRAIQILKKVHNIIAQNYGAASNDPTKEC